MIHAIRKKLALTCMIVTACILSLITALSLLIFEKHYKQEQHNLLAHHMDTLLLDFQNRSFINSPSLLELEAKNHLFIFIEKDEKLLSFTSTVSQGTPREALFEHAKNLALDQYNFFPSSLYTSTSNTPKITFDMYLASKEHFLVTATTYNNALGHFNFYILKDQKKPDRYLGMIRLLFICLTIVGFLLLGLFCFWFSDRAIMPLLLARKQQSEFIAAASHELRSPLAVIEMNATALQHGTADDSPEFLTNIHTECHRMKRLIDDLLLLANSDAHSWSIQLAPVEMDLVLIDVYELFLPKSHKKHISLTLDLPYEIIPAVQADRERMVQILSILIDNAFSYTPENGKITLKLKQDKNALLIFVIDTGIGISDEHKPYVFNRFYRVDTSRHQKTHYGLGLSIAYELMKCHNGQITIEDTPNGGATFVLHLPL